MSNKKFQLYGAPFEAGIHADTAQGVDSANGPDEVRKLFAELYANYNIPTFINDHGDIECTASSDVDSVLTAVENTVESILKSKEQFLIFGGSHTITLGTQRALRKNAGNYSLIYFDAHPDCMPEKEIHYGSSIYHAIEEGNVDPNRLLYIGIRHIEDEEQSYIEKKKIKCLYGDDFLTNDWMPRFEQLSSQLPPPYVLSIDLDSIDPMYAPGVSTPYPFGLSLRELLLMAKTFCGKDLLGFEIVELAPKFDTNATTARIAAGLIHELTKACSIS